VSEYSRFCGGKIRSTNFQAFLMFRQPHAKILAFRLVAAENASVEQSAGTVRGGPFLAIVLT
jgi:hypothetical protein